MIDQKTPDPWDYLAEFIEGNAVRPPGGQQVGPPRYPLVPSVAKELRGIVEAGKRALAAERAQHQQEIADETAKRVRLAENWSKERQAANAELAQRDETIRQLQDAFARCQEVQQATAETWRIEHDQMAEQIRLLRGAMAADDERLRRAAEQAGILYVSCDTAEALAEQIARLSAQVRKLEAELALARSAGSRDLNLRMNEANKALRAERDAAQQQIATLTQARNTLATRLALQVGDASELAMLGNLIEQWTRADAVQHGERWDSRALKAKRANELIHRVNATLEAAEARCATLTAALEQLRDCDWTIGRGDRMDAVRDIARAALSGVPTP